MIILNEELFCPGETVAVALSGGEDSVCLLHLLVKNAERLNIKVVALNVEHGIRGAESKSDTAFCVKLCEKLGIEIKVYSVDAVSFAENNRMSLEQAARVLRYERFFEALNEGFCHKIATAHHLADNAETILFNLFRGSSLTGVKGIEERTYGGKVVRPILMTEKAEITEYLKENQLEFVTDFTNFDSKYTRNAMRLEILPIIEKKFPSVKNALVRFSKNAKKDDEFLYDTARKSIIEENGAFKIPIDLEYPLFSRCVVLALKGLGVEKDYDSSHIDALFDLTSNQTGKKAQLLDGVEGVREYSFLVLRKNVANFKGEGIPFKIGDVKMAGKHVRVERVEFFQKEDNAWFLDLDKLPKDCVFRYKKDGDRIEKFGGGEVSLKKYLTDKKVPSYEKERKILLASGNNVFWVENIDVSRAVKIDKDSKNIVKLSIF